jgi:uncharacterized protein
MHGVGHWVRVERNGIYIAQNTGADEVVVRMFSLFHDCQRISDSSDPGHGVRGSRYARSVRELLLCLNVDQFDQLCFACDWHTDHDFNDDITIATCWDADRLDLGRVGVNPDPQLLNTEIAKVIAGSRDYLRLECLPVREIVL